MGKNYSLRVSKIIAFLLLLLIFFTPLAIVNAGERGVLIRLGKVQDKILGEGIHLIMPVINTVEKLSVRIQKQEIASEAFSKDLQKIFTDIAINWHIIPTEANAIFRRIGSETEVVDRIIDPAIEEVLKLVFAKYTTEEMIGKRRQLKNEIEDKLTTRLAKYHVAIDDVSLVRIQFSERFRQAVEAKQIAEQEAKKAKFLALKALNEAKANINLSQGEAEAQMLLRETLSPKLILKQAIEKWDGHLPSIVESGLN